MTLKFNIGTLYDAFFLNCGALYGTEQIGHSTRCIFVCVSQKQENHIYINVKNIIQNIFWDYYSF